MTKSKDLAETVNQKKTRQQKEINPFEVHINKKKRSVIGQKSKNDRGLPGVARDKTYKMVCIFCYAYQLPTAHKFIVNIFHEVGYFMIWYLVGFMCLLIKLDMQNFTLSVITPASNCCFIF